MVLFKCRTCSANVMYKDVSKHVGKCSGDLSLTCVDCKADFLGQRYETHARCSAGRVAPLPPLPMATEFLVEPQAAKKMPNETVKARTPRTKGPKAAKKSLSGTASTGNQYSVSQEQWREAGRSALKDPNLTEQQRTLMANACKRRPPGSIKTVAKTVLLVNQNLMHKLCAEDLVHELISMIESEFKNINGSQQEDITKLTKNQQMIGSILSASEAPGLQANQKTLLTSLAKDKSKQNSLLRGYVRDLWRVCHHRAENAVSQASKKLAEQLNEIKKNGPGATPLQNGEGIKKGSGIGKKGKEIRKKLKLKKGKENNAGLQIGGNENENSKNQQTNGVKEDNTEEETKKDKKERKEKKLRAKNGKENHADLQSGENVNDQHADVELKIKKEKKKKQKLEIDNAEQTGDTDISSESSKKKKRKGEGHDCEVIPKPGDDLTNEVEENSPRKRKKRSEGDKAADEIRVENANGDSEHATRKKSKKHKKRNESEGE